MAANDPKIQIDVTARDKASEVIDDVADAAKHLEKLDPDVKVTADTSAAEADLKAVDAAAGRVSKDDTVLVITAKIDQAKADLEKLQGELRATDDAAGETGNRIGTDIEEGTTKAQGAVHSMAGNVIGDGAAMATGMGPLGEALGQITEGALGGEVALREMLTAGLGLAAITVVVGAITKGLEANKRVDAFNKKTVEDFTKALRDAKTEVDIFNQAITKTDTGQVTFVDAIGNTRDLTAALAAGGITWDDFIAHVAGGADAFKQWVITMGPVIGAGKDLNAIIQAGTQYIKDRDAAQKSYDDQLVVSGQVASETDRETRKLNKAWVDGSDAAAGLKQPVDTATRSVNHFREESALASDAYRRLTDNLDEQQAWADVNQAIKDYNENTKRSDEDTRNLIRSVADYVAQTDTIPASKKTEIFADLNSGDVAKIEADMTELTRNRNIQILLKAVGSQDTIKLLKKVGIGGGIVDESATVGSAAAAVPQTVNVMLPRGARHGDIARALGVSSRRNGSRYGVSYARR
jgi:hypothetical protein